MLTGPYVGWLTETEATIGWVIDLIQPDALVAPALAGRSGLSLAVEHDTAAPAERDARRVRPERRLREHQEVRVVCLVEGRDHEVEADQMGLLYMARAGYNPEESIAFWERMAEAGGGGPPEFMSTHPSHGTRQQTLREFLPKAMAEYEKSRGESIAR